MQIVCPNCKTRFSFDETKIAGQGIKLRCSKCKAIFKATRRSVESDIPSENFFNDAVKKYKLFVANESAAFCSAIQKVLSGEPFDVIVFHDGLEALKAIESEKPDAVLLDVALPSMYGFEICEAVRRNNSLDNVKLILVASIYDKTKYKRTPSSLYGADAYIEKHHIPDSLSALVKKLVAEKASNEQISQDLPVNIEGLVPGIEMNEIVNSLSNKAEGEEFRRDEELQTTVSIKSLPGISSQELSETGIKAKRLARIIVSDILLYNQDKVIEGIKRGNLYDLLKEEIREGKALYARRVPQEVLDGTAFLDDAFEQLISSKRREIGI